MHHLIDRPEEDFAQGNSSAADELLGYSGVCPGWTEASAAKEKPIEPHVKESNMLFVGYWALQSVVALHVVRLTLPHVKVDRTGVIRRQLIPVWSKGAKEGDVQKRRAEGAGSEDEGIKSV